MIRDTSREAAPSAPSPAPPPPPRPSHASHILAWLVFWAVLLVGGYFGYQAWERQRNKPATTMPSRSDRNTPVVAAVAKRGDFNQYLQELGTVTPLNTVSVRSRVGGEITRVAFTEGQLVKAGDVLLEIDPRPFEVQVTQAQAQLAHDQAVLKNAQADLERFKSAPETVTQQQLSTQEANVAQANALLQTDQAKIDDAKLQLSYCKITAPITGRIGLRQVDLGNIIQANDSRVLAVITQVQPISVMFSVPEDEISRVTRAMSRGKVTVDAYEDDDRTKIATGALAAIDNQVDPSTLTIRLRADFANENGVLFPNQSVRAHLLVDTLKDVVLIPTLARQLGPPPNTTFVYVVGPDHTVELRNIKTGPSEDDRTVVLEGLRDGETVVTNGVDKLIPGSKVTVQLEGEGPSTRPASGRRGRGAKGGGSATHPAPNPQGP